MSKSEPNNPKMFRDKKRMEVFICCLEGCDKIT